MSSISREQIAHVAHLARLDLTEEELNNFSVQIESIIDYMSSIANVDCAGVVPTVHPDPTVNHVREDLPLPSLSQSEALAMAPDVNDGRFVVPQILGEQS